MFNYNYYFVFQDTFQEKRQERQKRKSNYNSRIGAGGGTRQFLSVLE